MPGDRLRVEAEGPGHLHAAGEIDVSTAPMFRRRIMGMSQPVVRVDLSHVRFIDSSGLRVLLSAHGELAEEGRRLEVLRPSRSVRRLLELTALDRHLHLVDGTPTAQEHD